MLEIAAIMIIDAIKPYIKELKGFSPVSSFILFGKDLRFVLSFLRISTKYMIKIPRAARN